MPSFGARSRKHLLTCHPRLQEVLGEAILYTDFAVLCGLRSREAQDEAFATGRSKVKWPSSKHNAPDGGPSLAVDVAPWPIDWKDSLAFAVLAGRILQIADAKGIALRWGGDWDRDGESNDQSFMDIGHFEMM